MELNIGIGFATGRRLFQNVLKTYINNWLEHGLVHDQGIKLHLFIAYDLKYKNTRLSDYKNIPVELADMVESINFYGNKEISDEIENLSASNILDSKEAHLLFGEGYGKKRNIITYFAIKHKMDKLIFIDDDEYPIATLKNKQENLMWMGQSILSTHLKYNDQADITHGHHCGYISPIPYLKFTEELPEKDFKNFIEAISNDIITWDKIKHLILEDRGVTFAEAAILNEAQVTEVAEENGMKFISGANLCFNLKNFKELPPFYNPPGARGEDTFMSTALSELKVLKVPCYTFHDGFSMYNNILHGVLPITLLPIEANSEVIIKRFVNATIGWVRYKPLLVYITNRQGYETAMQEMEVKLKSSIPKLCRYFKTKDFEKILPEFETYKRNAKKHFEEFEHTKAAWSKLLNSMV
jgi:hypothetical protein